VTAGTAANFASSQSHNYRRVLTAQISGRVFREYAALHLLTCGFAIEARASVVMNNKQHIRNFTRSDDALILEQPVTRVGLKILARMMHTSQERVMRRADELGVSLAISDDHDGAVDTRTLRDELVDPLLERLKRIHGDRK
jgi:hypothetical protein